MLITCGDDVYQLGKSCFDHFVPGVIAVTLCGGGAHLPGLHQSRVSSDAKSSYSECKHTHTHVSNGFTMVGLKFNCMSFPSAGDMKLLQELIAHFCEEIFLNSQFS